MHFYCTCGNRISDTTDFLSYKAYFYADQDLEDLTDSIEKEIMNESLSREKCVDNIICGHMFNYNHRNMYLCKQCGRLFVDDLTGKHFHIFAPEGEVNTQLLQSVKGEAWKGFLWAEWIDEKPQWQEYHGYVSASVNVPYGGFTFDDREAFEKKYYALFEELKLRGIIRSASMKINKEWIHHWKAEDADSDGT